MKIDDIKKIAKNRTQGFWTLEQTDEYYRAISPYGLLSEESFEDQECYSSAPEINDARFFVMAANYIDYLITIAEAAKDFCDSNCSENSTCSGCVEDEKGTHLERLENALQKLDEARRG